MINMTRAPTLMLGQSRAESQDEQEPALRERPTVLIVDDDPNIGRLLRMHLREAGFEPVYASDGFEALRLLVLHEPALVLLDVMLPGMSGWEVCQELRRSTDVPILMLTSKQGEHDIVRGLSLGADEYMAKPFSGPELLARVRRVMKKVRQPLPLAERPQPPALPQPTPQSWHVEAAPETPGSRLKSARLALSLTLYHIERDLQIRWDYLQAVEKGQLDHVPREIQRRIVIRYAHYLGLNPDPIWMELLQSRVPRPRRQLEPARPRARAHSRLYLIAFTALMILVVLAVPILQRA